MKALFWLQNGKSTFNQRRLEGKLAIANILPLTSLLHEFEVTLNSTLLASQCDPTFHSIALAKSMLNHHPPIHPYPFLPHPGSLPYQP